MTGTTEGGGFRSGLLEHSNWVGRGQEHGKDRVFDVLDVVRRVGRRRESRVGRGSLREGRGLRGGSLRLVRTTVYHQRNLGGVQLRGTWSELGGSGCVWGEEEEKGLTLWFILACKWGGLVGGGSRQRGLCL